MARKKARKNAELDEEGLKKIYTNKNFIRPEEKELATINEDEDESSPDVLQDIGTTKENDLVDRCSSNYENITSLSLKVRASCIATIINYFNSKFVSNRVTSK